MDNEHSSKKEGIKLPKTPNILSVDMKIPFKCRISSSVTVHPAYNNTFVVCSWDMYHVNQDGNVIKERELQKSFYIWGRQMLTDKIFSLWMYNQQTKSCQFHQWNLQSDSLLKFKVAPEFKQQQASLLIFPETQLLCIIQTEIQPDKSAKMKISYFKYPLLLQTDKPFYEFRLLIKQGDRFRAPCKINNHSGIVWVQQHNNTTVMNRFDPRDQTHEIRTYTLDHIFNQNKSITRTRLESFWEPQPGFIYAKYVIRVSYSLFKMQNSANQNPTKQQFDEQGVHQLIWEYKENNYRIPKYACKSQHQIQFLSGFRKIQRFSLPEKKYSPPVKYPPPRYDRHPVYYVNFQRQQIVAYQSSNNKKYSLAQVKNHGFDYPCYKNNMYLEHELIQIEGKQPQLRIAFCKLKQIFQSIECVLAFFMCGMLTEIDEELMQKAIQMAEKQTEGTSEQIPSFITNENKSDRQQNIF